MKIAKLLGTGKSFVNGGKVVAYRENKRAYLPKFISPKNPFAPKAPEQNSVTPAPAQKIVTPAITNEQKIPVFGGPVRGTNWAEKLNPFRATKPVSAAQFTVQPELSLASIKVVQNDLTDADVEIVPMKSRPVQTTEANLSAAREPWEFLGERLLKSY
jgi:hypothetical protein